MPVIRKFQEKEGVIVFDSVWDESLSTYEAAHLEVLAKHEEDHFWFGSRYQWIAQAMLRHVPRSARILEVGGGTGFIAGRLKQLGFHMEMAEIHSQGFSHAKNRGIDALYQFDLFNPPFEREFEGICLFDVLEHLQDPLQALQCVKKMLKPHGLVIVTVPAHRWLWSREDRIAGHHRRYSQSELQDLFHRGGLQPLQIRYFFSSLLPFLWVRKWLRFDDGTPLRPNETFDAKINPFFNGLCKLLTQLELKMDRVLPPLPGGSLLGVGRKIE